jgi:hypothetical protein
VPGRLQSATIRTPIRSPALPPVAGRAVADDAAAHRASRPAKAKEGDRGGIEHRTTGDATVNGRDRSRLNRCVD